MIQAQELRIGNWVLDSDRDNPYFHQVVRIETKEYTDWNSGDEFNVVCLLEGTKDGYFEMIPSPIPLTEEWLVRFGFKKMDDNWYTHENYNLERDERGFWLSFQTLQLSEILNYVHQLQNLHFALTGQELKLNDK